MAGCAVGAVVPDPNKVEPDSELDGAVVAGLAPKKLPLGAPAVVELKSPPLEADVAGADPNNPPLGAVVDAAPNSPLLEADVVGASKRDELAIVVAGLPKLKGAEVLADMLPNKEGVEAWVEFVVEKRPGCACVSEREVEASKVDCFLFAPGSVLVLTVRPEKRPLDADAFDVL